MCWLLVPEYGVGPKREALGGYESARLDQSVARNELRSCTQWVKQLHAMSYVVARWMNKWLLLTLCSVTDHVVVSQPQPHSLTATVTHHTSTALHTTPPMVYTVESPWWWFFTRSHYQQPSSIGSMANSFVVFTRFWYVCFDYCLFNDSKKWIDCILS